jgi:hypothetical protein
LLTPRLSSLWLGLTTPVYARVGRKLIESVENETTVRDDRALQVFPIRPMGLRQAIQRAILNEEQQYAATRWSDAISSAGLPPSWGGMRFGTRLVDSRVVHVPVTPATAAVPMGGSTAIGCGGCAVSLICCSVGWACGVVAATRRSWRWEIPSISGVSSPTSRTAGCV